jgi:hypothetical protein
MATEYPPLGKPFVAEYRYGDRGFPVIHIKKDPRVENYRAPEVGDPCPDKRFPDHTFIQALPTNSDERVLWVYEKLDGPQISGQIIDRDGNIATLTRQPVVSGSSVDQGYKVLSSSINPENKAFGVKETITVDEFPVLRGVQIDPRYGVALEYTKELVDAETAEGGVDGLESVEIEPKDQWRSWKLTTKLAQLPQDQVWYGYRKEAFPDVLTGLTIVGTENYQPVPTWRTAPDMPFKARYTRKFSLGPPPEPAPTLSPRYWAEPFYFAVEYLRESESESESASSSRNSGSSSSTNSSTQSSASSGTSSSTSSGTNSSTNSGTSSGTNSSTNSGSASGTSSSTNSGTNSSTNSGTQSSSGSGTSSSTNSGTSSSTNSGTGSSTSSGTNSSTNSGTNSSNQVSSGIGGSSTTESENGGAALVGGPTTNRASSYTSTTEGSGSSSSSNSGTQSGTNSGTNSSTNSGTNSSTNSGTNSSTSSGTSSSSNSGTSSSSGSGTNSSTSSSQNSGTSSGTQSSTSSGTSSSTSSGTSESTSVGTSESTSEGTSESVNQSESENATVSRGKSIFNLTLPKCLRSAINVALPSGEAFTIPATRQTDLNWGNYIEVARQSEHWKQGIWITEIIEVYLPQI